MAGRTSCRSAGRPSRSIVARLRHTTLRSARSPSLRISSVVGIPTRYTDLDPGQPRQCLAQRLLVCGVADGVHALQPAMQAHRRLDGRPERVGGGGEDAGDAGWERPRPRLPVRTVEDHGDSRKEPVALAQHEGQRLVARGQNELEVARCVGRGQEVPESLLLLRVVPRRGPEGLAVDDGLGPAGPDPEQLLPQRLVHLGGETGAVARDAKDHGGVVRHARRLRHRSGGAGGRAQNHCGREASQAGVDAPHWARGTYLRSIMLPSGRNRTTSRRGARLRTRGAQGAVRADDFRRERVVTNESGWGDFRSNGGQASAGCRLDAGERAARDPAPGQGFAVLLTNARRFPSGDHDGTFIVPWPPYRYAITLGVPPSRDTSRRYTRL